MKERIVDQNIVLYILPSGEAVAFTDIDRLYAFFNERSHTGQEAISFLQGLSKECYDYGQTAAAIEALERSLAIEGTSEGKAESILVMGQIIEGTCDFEGAARAYARAFIMPPGTGSTWYFLHNNLGFCLNFLGRYAEAEPLLRKAAEIDPSLPNAYKNLGISLHGLGRIEEAASSFRHATELNPDDPRGLQLLKRMLGE